MAPAQRREERRARLLHAGIQQFGARGFHNTTVRDLCREAQLTERYFYESFENLGALFVAVHRQVNDQLRTLTLHAVMTAERQPLAMVDAALRVYLEFLHQDPLRGRVLLFESVLMGNKVPERATAHRHDYSKLLRSFVQLLFPQASQQGFQIDMLCNGLIGATNYMAYDWLREDFKTPQADVQRTILSFYRGLLLQLSEVDKQPPSAPSSERPAAREKTATKRASKAKTSAK